MEELQIIESGSLMNMTKDQLVKIILRKDELERNLRKEIEGLKEMNADCCPGINDASQVNIVTNQTSSSEEKDDAEFSIDCLQIEKTLLQCSRDRWRSYAFCFLTIAITQFIYIIL